MLRADTTLQRDRRFQRFLYRGLRTMGVGLIFAVVLTTAYGHDFWKTLVYSTCISVGCWFCIDAGRIVLTRWVDRHEPSHGASGRWPGWKWMILVVPIGTLVGYTIGNAVANGITGYNNPGIFGGNALRQAFGLLIIALIPGIGITYFFYSRERLAMSDAQAETARRQASENQLKLLESQLEPHMLFNTLANLRVLIATDQRRAQAMLDRLIAFQRATLQASRSSSHSLAVEFARIGDYMELMKIRMGERLQPQLELPPELAEQPVPALLLQPLVENAIKHGLEPHVNGGRLIISAAREGDTLVLRVRDTGAGLGRGAAGEGNGEGTNFGLRQVRERLATLHDRKASLELADVADEDGGTIATVRLPIG